MKTSFDNNKGFCIEGLTMDELYLIKSILEDVQCDCNERDYLDDEIEVNVVLAEHEVEIIKGIEIEE